jgi:SAM-dependent methyltransferase
MAVTSERSGREAEFWDDHVVPLDLCLESVAAGPDPNSAALLDAVEPLAGCRLLDFACGSGITAVWAAQRGATVTAVDVSSASIERANELAEAAGVEIVTKVLTEPLPDIGTFDVMIGRYALHHVDLATYLPWLAERLAPGGRAAFLETMDSNPALALARRVLPGRFGVVSMGSDDEHPLRRRDLAAIADHLGPVETSAGQVNFFKLVDRRLLQGRWPRVGRTLAGADRLLHRLPGTTWLSYHQVLAVDRRP